MHKGQTPSPGADAGTSRRGDRPPGGRRRGQPVLRKLRTTDDFRCANLTLAQRKLILFVAVVMADEDDCLSATYEALLAAHAHEPEHWTHGHTLTSLQKRASRYVGRGAEYLPGWDKIVDVLRVAVPEPRLAAVLAEAAGLYSRAIDAEKPVRDYSGEIRLPVWEDRPTVSVEDIRAGLVRQQHFDLVMFVRFVGGVWFGGGASGRGLGGVVATRASAGGALRAGTGG